MNRLLAPLLVLCWLARMTAAADEGKEYVSDLIQQHKGSPAKLHGNDGITTRATFKPPVEVTIVAKTETTNLRVGYAADIVIFNWEGSVSDLRIHGGPADLKHKTGAGLIPTKKYVTIRWRVTPSKQSIYVDNDLRFEHEGDYSGLNKPVSVMSHDSQVTVRSIKVLQLPAGTK